MKYRSTAHTIMGLAALVALLTLDAGPASAQAGARLCQRIGTQHEQLECTRAVAAGEVNEAAFQVCSRIGTNHEILQCARAVAGRPLPQAATQLCTRIGTNSELVRCAQALAGHQLTDGAARTCSRIGTNHEIVQCAEAARDKTYSPDELALCGRNGTNQGIVACMQAAGRQAQPAARAQPTQQGGSGGVAVAIVNDTDARFARVYVRAHGATRWPSRAWQGSATAGQQIQLSVQPGQWDVCIETPDGHSTWWSPVNVRPSGERLIVSGSRNDARLFSRQECHTL